MIGRLCQGSTCRGTEGFVPYLRLSRCSFTAGELNSSDFASTYSWVELYCCLTSRNSSHNGLHAFDWGQCSPSRDWLLPSNTQSLEAAHNMSLSLQHQKVATAQRTKGSTKAKPLSYLLNDRMVGRDKEGCADNVRPLIPLYNKFYKRNKDIIPESSQILPPCYQS